ncbi:MAG: hypothetical protein VSS75_022970 [Candidatus Parabeggiatoa sp.]|nr:hypothetical protein [Candidatus Parabeggiatoa sp.]
MVNISKRGHFLPLVYGVCLLIPTNVISYDKIMGNKSIENVIKSHLTIFHHHHVLWLAIL